MAELGSYTTTEAVRACLGIDEADCADEVMTDSLLDIELVIDLDAWLPSHAALFSAGAATGATADEVKTRNLMKLYAQWFCAREISARPLLVPQISTDGKTQMDRFKVKLADVQKYAADSASRYKSALLGVVGQPIPVAGSASLLLVAPPDSDPITTAIQ